MQIRFTSLLKQFSKISINANRDATYLEISGHPHYENVSSNILSFFLDPLREHNLKDLLISSLLQASGYDLQLSNIQIEREKQTSNGRIDILIESDSHIIVIENKIFHHANNPFNDYQEKAKSIAKGRECIFLILGLKKESGGLLRGFKSITYNDLFSTVKLNIGRYIQESNNKYLILLTEFISSIEHLSSGSNMDKSVIEFFAQNESQTTEFIDAFNSIKRELRNKINKLRQQLEIDEKSITRSGLHRESNILADCIFHDLNLDGENIAIDCYIHPHGWEISIFPRSYGSTQNLQDSLKVRNIPFKHGERLLYGEKYNFDEPEENIANTLQELIIKLQEAPNK